MAIDLREATAKPQVLAYVYREYPSFEAFTEAVQRGEADVAFSNLTITKDRAERITFSQPWYDGFAFRHGDNLSHAITLQILALQETSEL